MMAWVYEHNKDNTERYLLGEPGKNNLVCIGVNPSTATPEKLDPTLRRVKRFAADNGFDGWMMLNLYPVRSTNPNDLHKYKDGFKISRNITNGVLPGIQYENVTIWCAWGTLIKKRSYLIESLKRIYCQIQDRDIVAIGELTKDGHPRHPLYLKADSPIIEFDLLKYLWGDS